MVGPVSSEERKSFTTRVKIGFTLLIGISTGLITLQGDPSLLVFLAAVVAGTAVGGVIVWYVFPESGNIADDRTRR